MSPVLYQEASVHPDSPLSPFCQKSFTPGTKVVPGFQEQGTLHLSTLSPTRMWGGERLERGRRGGKWKCANNGKPSPYVRSDVRPVEAQGMVRGGVEVAPGRTAVINTLQAKTTRDTPEVELVGFTALCSQEEHIPWGTVGHLGKRVLGGLVIGFGLCF